MHLHWINETNFILVFDVPLLTFDDLLNALHRKKKFLINEISYLILQFWRTHHLLLSFLLFFVELIMLLIKNLLITLKSFLKNIKKLSVPVFDNGISSPLEN